MHVHPEGSAVNGRISGVYAIVHRASGRAYVGSSGNVFKRWWHHANQLNHGTHHSPALQELWLLDGPNAFTFVLLEQCPIKDLVIREQEWIDSFSDPLNASLVAKCAASDPRVAAKMAATRRGKRRDPDIGRKIAAALRGQPLSEERKRKISEARKGKPQTEKQRAHLAHLHALLRGTRERRYKLVNLTRQPEIRAHQLERHWSRSPNAALIAARISQAKRKEAKDG